MIVESAPVRSGLADLVRVFHFGLNYWLAVVQIYAFDTVGHISSKKLCLYSAAHAPRNRSMGFH